MVRKVLICLCTGCALFVVTAGTGSSDQDPASKVCQTKADCTATQFCEFKAGVCEAPGTCEESPEACTEIYQPVCGCDDKTYGNDCQRKAAGVSLKSEGECPQRT